MWKLAFVLVCLFYPCSASYSTPAFSSGSAGAAFNYAEIQQFFKEILHNANRVTTIEYYQSPVQNYEWLSHHQIIFQVDNKYWLLISLGFNGLEVGASLQKNELVNRRRRNMLMRSFNVNVPAEKMKALLKYNKGKNFHLLEWNCQNFAGSIWRSILDYDLMY